jgi:hypothetical protein
VRRFWKRDEIDSLLREHRPTAEPTLMRSVVRKIEQAPRVHTRRVALAGVATAVALIGFGAVGGLGYAAHAVSSAAVAVSGSSSAEAPALSLKSSAPTQSATPSKDKPKDGKDNNDNGNNGNNGNNDNGNNGDNGKDNNDNGEDNNDNGNNGEDENESEDTQSSSDDQYGGKTTICHHTSSKKNPWVLITVSNNALPAHKKHGDTLPSDGNCPGPPIP